MENFLKIGKILVSPHFAKIEFSTDLDVLRVEEASPNISTMMSVCLYVCVDVCVCVWMYVNLL